LEAELASLGARMMWIGLLEVRLSIEDTIRGAVQCIDREQWHPKQRGDKILLKSERFTAEITGAQYDKEAVCKYIAAVSPENIAGLLKVIDTLRAEISDMRAQKDYSLSEDIQRDLVKLAFRVSMEMNRNGRQDKVEE
jgi:hypothetical protein